MTFEDNWLKPDLGNKTCQPELSSQACLPSEDHPRGPNQKANPHQDFSSRLGEESKDGVEDIFLFLRDDAGGRVLLEGTVSLLLAHLKRKRNLSARSTREWIGSAESLTAEVAAAKPKANLPPCPCSSGQGGGGGESCEAEAIAST